MSNPSPATRIIWWDVGQSEVVDSWPLMGSPVPMLSIVAIYLTLVLYLGPRYMRHRQPYKLTSVMIMYNVTQVIMSSYVVSLALPYILKHGIVWMDCYMLEGSLKDQLLHGLWFYFIIKMTELTDTVLFVFRKKTHQVSFLHVYHHSTLVLATWLYLKYTPSEHIVFIGFINSIVHVVMYTYYGLAALGPALQPYLFWKKYITVLQLVQFVMIMFQIVSSYVVSSCPPHTYWVYFFVTNALLFIHLFTQFYKKTYMTNSQNILHKTL